ERIDASTITQRADEREPRDRPEEGGDLFGAPINDVARDEAAGGLEGLDGQAGAGGEDVVLAVEHHHARWALDHFLELEAELREAGERALVELTDGVAAAERAVPVGVAEQHGRALEDGVLGVVGEHTVKVAAVPALEPVPHQAFV